jgi:hypothetical protein
VSENKCVAPGEVIDVALQRRMPFELRRNVTEVRVLLVGREDGVEILLPEVVMSHLVSGCRKFFKHGVAQM